MPVAYQWDPVIMVTIVAAPVVVWLMLAAYHQRHDRVARALVWFSLSILIWVVGFGLEVAAADLTTLWFWLRFQFIGIMSVGPLWLLVLLRYVDADQRLGPWLWPLLAAPPLVCYLLLLTNDQHGLFYRELTLGNYTRGPFFWFNAAVAYTTFAASFVVVLMASRRAPPGQRQRLWLLAAASAVPLLPNVIFVALYLPSRLDPTPLLFAISGAIVFDLLTRGRLLAARPVALRTALAVASDAIIVTDLDGRIIETNPAARPLLGEPPFERLGPLLVAAGASPAERDRLTGQTPQSCLLRARGRVVEAQTVPILEDRRHQGMVAWLRDVTERERLVEQLRAAGAGLEARVQQRTLELAEARARADVRAAELASTLDAIPDGIILTDAVGVPRLANQAASHLLGVPVRTDLALVDQVATPDDPAVRQALHQVLAGERTDAVDLTIGSDTAARYLRISAAPVRDTAGQSTGMVVAVHDVSPLRQWEHARQEFLAMAAHELRSPATGILLATQVLQRRLARLPESERTATAVALDTLQRQTRRLNGLINDLVDSARLEGGFLVVEPTTFDLIELARRVIADSTTHPGQVALATPAPPVAVVADEARVEQIIANLLDNARKYSPPDHPLRVVVTIDAAAAYLTVIDEGIGIPAADLPRLFERFYRAGNVSSRGGLGLGLALSRELARHMGGEVTVESKEGRGSMVTLRLPRA